jgi:hypothetical protein
MTARALLLLAVLVCAAQSQPVDAPPYTFSSVLDDDWAADLVRGQYFQNEIFRRLNDCCSSASSPRPLV